MEARSTTSRVVRCRNRPLAGSLRYHPYNKRTVSEKKKEMKEEVVRLGVKLSMSVAETMLLLCYDIRIMLHICFRLWRYTSIPPFDPVSLWLLGVIHYVYTKHIKPKNGVYQDDGNIPAQWELVRTSWKELADGVIVLHRIDMALRRKDGSFDDRLLSSAIEKYKQDVLKKLEDKLRDVNGFGFVRETIESNIFDLWKSLFDDKEETTAPEVVGKRMMRDMFVPIYRKAIPREIVVALPICSPYILGEEFAKHEVVKEEVVRLGVELSLYVAQSMLLLRGDILTMLLLCFKLWRYTIPRSHPVSQRLLGVIHYVYTKLIIPKKEVYQDDGNISVESDLIRTTWQDLGDGVKVLHRMDMVLRGEEDGSFNVGRLLSAIEQYKEEVLTKLEDKLEDVNGFSRETIESDIFDMWKSLFDDKETTPEGVKRDIRIRDLFMPIYRKPLRREIMALPICCSSPYILGEEFAKHEETKEEVVRLGVELSLYVAQLMFLLRGDIRNMLRLCFNLWRSVKAIVRNESHVLDRLLRVMHHVYAKYIKSNKKGVVVYQNNNNGNILVQLMVDLAVGFRNLNIDIFFLIAAGGRCPFRLLSRVKERANKAEEKLRCVKSVSEANGFVREAMEPTILAMWESLYDKEAKEATWTLKAIKRQMVEDLFLPVSNQAALAALLVNPREVPVIQHYV